MNIVFSIDEKFVKHCAVTLTSLFQNNKCKFNIYILNSYLSIHSKNYLHEICSFNNSQLEFIDSSNIDVSMLPMPELLELKHISIATYFRLFIEKLLPKNIDKVLYLDSDLVIVDSIEYLWEISLDEFAIAAVYQLTQRTVSDLVRLNIPKNKGYFNAGVLLINLKYWRLNSMTDIFNEFIVNNYKLIKYHDQDVMNATLYDVTLELPCTFNYLPNMYDKYSIEYQDVEETSVLKSYYSYYIENLDENFIPKIIHYAAHPKPWDFFCNHPNSSLYHKYLKLTKFSSFKSNVIKIFNIFYFTARKFIIRPIMKIINILNNNVDYKLTPFLLYKLIYKFIYGYFIKNVLRIKGVKIDGKADFYGFPLIKLSSGSSIKIGNFVTLCSNSKYTPLGLNHPVILHTTNRFAKIKIGNNTGISGATICASNYISVGNRCLIGANVTIVDTDFHSIYPIGRFNNQYPNLIKSIPVFIDDDVFIGANSFIHKGVNIGRNSIIGANSVVISNISKNSIYAGNPAVKIGEIKQ